MTYYEQLKDPKWQRKRLEILNRDNFTCQRCDDTKTTLHVHHKYYEKGKYAWEYEDKSLITLCADCHESEESEIKQYSALMVETLKQSVFFADDWREIASGINKADLKYKSSVVAYIVSEFIKRSDLQELVLIKLQKEYKQKRNKK